MTLALIQVVDKHIYQVVIGHNLLVTIIYQAHLLVLYF